MLGSNIANATTQVVTDPSNDVESVTWNTSLSKAESSEGQSKPVIDITSIDYGTTNAGNVTITLNLVGTPAIDNKTFYLVSAEHDESNLSILLWTGAYLTASEEDYSYVFVSYLEAVSLSPLGYTPEITGTSLVWTLPRTVMQLNFTSFEYEDVPLNLPATPDSAWTWDATAWTGTVPYSSALTSAGTWWLDNLDSSSGTGTNTGTDSTDDASAPGFEVLPLIGFISVTSLFVIIQRKEKLIKK